jgi:hypothetical protein
MSENKSWLGLSTLHKYYEVVLKNNGSQSLNLHVGLSRKLIES